ncbi:MAG: hypothetical protein JWM27_3820 [Gemmatimonadetes bacterium]|nr:hypothetical protein [Gemmatimonadota bacterium]
MKPHRDAFRRLVLLMPLAAAAAGFARGGQQTPCPAVLAGRSCQVNGFYAYFSATATGSVRSDSIVLTDGAVFLAPVHPGHGSAPRRARAAAFGPGVVVYTTASGPSQAGQHISVPRRIRTPDTAARMLVAYRASGTDTSVVVALVGGRLAALPSLKPGCEVTVSAEGGSAPRRVADDSATLTALAAFHGRFGVATTAPTPERC